MLLNDDIYDLLTDALITDGAHHKQWYIEESLRKMGVNLEKLRKELKKENYAWEKGIPP